MSLKPDVMTQMRDLFEKKQEEQISFDTGNEFTGHESFTADDSFAPMSGDVARAWARYTSLAKEPQPGRARVP